MKHCCELMRDFVKDVRLPIEYSPLIREYFLTIPNSIATITITDCPWCGSQLPASLRKEYFYILEREHGIKMPYDIKTYHIDIVRDDFPEKFKSDEWWREREL